MPALGPAPGGRVPPRRAGAAAPRRRGPRAARAASAQVFLATRPSPSSSRPLHPGASPLSVRSRWTSWSLAVPPPAAPSAQRPLPLGPALRGGGGAAPLVEYVAAGFTTGEGRSRSSSAPAPSPPSARALRVVPPSLELGAPALSVPGRLVNAPPLKLRLLEGAIEPRPPLAGSSPGRASLAHFNASGPGVFPLYLENAAGAPARERAVSAPRALRGRGASASTSLPRAGGPQGGGEWSPLPALEAASAPSVRCSGSGWAPSSSRSPSSCSAARGPLIERSRGLGRSPPPLGGRGPAGGGPSSRATCSRGSSRRTTHEEVLALCGRDTSRSGSGSARRSGAPSSTRGAGSCRSSGGTSCGSCRA